MMLVISGVVMAIVSVAALIMGMLAIGAQYALPSLIPKEVAYSMIGVSTSFALVLISGSMIVKKIIFKFEKRTEAISSALLDPNSQLSRNTYGSQVGPHGSIPYESEGLWMVYHYGANQAQLVIFPTREQQQQFLAE